MIINNNHLPKTHLFCQGYTMVELMITMIVMTIVYSAFVPNFLDISKQKAELVISEMWIINQAIQVYDAQESEFPDSSNNCENALTILANHSLLAALATNTGSTPWGLDARYITHCNGTTPTLMTLSIVTNEKWAPYIENGLPATTSDGPTTTLNIVKLAYTAVLEKLLALSDTPTIAIVNGVTVTDATVSPSGTYIAQGNINMDGFTLYGQEPKHKRIIFATVAEPVPVTSPNSGQIMSTINSIEVFDDATSFITGNFLVPTNLTDFYGYAHLKVLVEQSGIYIFRPHITANSEDGFYGTLATEISSASSVILIKQYINTSINLTEGEIIEIKLYYHSDVMTNENLQIRILKAPNSGLSNTRLITDHDSGLKIIDNLLDAKIPDELLHLNYNEVTSVIARGYGTSASGTYLAKGNISMNGFSTYDLGVGSNFVPYSLTGAAQTIIIENASDVIGLTFFTRVDSTTNAMLNTIIFNNLRGDILVTVQGLIVTFSTYRMVSFIININNANNTISISNINQQQIFLGDGNRTLDPNAFGLDKMIVIY